MSARDPNCRAFHSRLTVAGPRRPQRIIDKWRLVHVCLISSWFVWNMGISMLTRCFLERSHWLNARRSERSDWTAPSSWQQFVQLLGGGGFEILDQVRSRIIFRLRRRCIEGVCGGVVVSIINRSRVNLTNWILIAFEYL